MDIKDAGVQVLQVQGYSESLMSPWVVSPDTASSKLTKCINKKIIKRKCMLAVEGHKLMLKHLHNMHKALCSISSPEHNLTHVRYTWKIRKKT